MTKPDSPAFPEDRGLDSLYSGLTIREYMATHIMAGFAANEKSAVPVRNRQEADSIIGSMAEAVVVWTDALIAALNQTPAAPDRKGG